ncbi:MAG: amino acid ABC transporter permease [Clostridia bacterium]|jgi:putative lysine transport system permease protein|nr:amino acid ABC transporter permease [Clostridia bacterium]MCI9085417.1 amino acid ABC transporter permease [Clostridia bacterium]NDO19775.1 amino acid ABC transporter permease [Lachnospiraceae bacterium MD329]
MGNTPNGVFEWVLFIAREYSDLFITGTIITLAVAVIGTLIGFVLGFVMGIVEDTKIDKDDNIVWKVILGLLKSICKIYIEIFRDTPMIVQAMIIYFGIRQCGFEIDPIAAGIIVTTLNTGAYMAETVRGGIKSIDVGQREGALAMGMSPVSVMMFIVLPQAFKNIIPEMVNMFLTNLKMTSVLNVIGVKELFLQAKTAGGTYYKYLESYLTIAVIYFVLCFVFNRLFLLLEKKIAGKKDYVLAVEHMDNNE